MFCQPVYRITEISSLTNINKECLVNGALEFTKAELIDRLSCHKEIDRKDKCGVFIPAVFKSPDDWQLSVKVGSSAPSFRNDNNIESITLIVLDLDYENELENAKKVLAGFEYIVYSTYSYNNENQNNYRMILFPSEEISASVWSFVFSSISNAISIDSSCRNLSRVYYYPSISKKAGVKPFFEHVPGRAISIDDIFAISTKHSIAVRKKVVVSGVGALPHPSGGVCRRSYKTFLSGIDDVFSEMCERYKYQINRLQQSDHRHEFALTVIKHTVEVYGRSVDWLPILKFIFYGADKWSMKRLVDGNTVNEIHDMVFSAYQKFAPDQLLCADDMIELANLLTSALSKIEVVLQSCPINWGFNLEKKVVISDRLLDVSQKNSDVESLSSRFGGDIQRCFVNKGSLLNLISLISKKEYIRVTGKFNIVNIFTLVFVEYKKFLYSVERPTIKQDFDRFSTSIATQIRKGALVVPTNTSNDVDFLLNSLRAAYALTVG